MEEQLIHVGVTVLHGEVSRLQKGKDTIQIIGLDDPDFVHPSSNEISNALNEAFTIMLAHRPEVVMIRLSTSK